MKQAKSNEGSNSPSKLSESESEGEGNSDEDSIRSYNEKANIEPNQVQSGMLIFIDRK